MKLFSPWALWFLSFMPLVVLMYILKQKFEEQQIGSIYLWQQVLKDIEVNTPWQKLKKNLLLLLQLLCILLLVFALSDPYIFTGGGMYSNLVIVIDNTGSMNAKYQGSTRLAKAKQLAGEMINRSGANANISLLTVERSPRVEIGKTTDKGEAESRLRAIKPGNSSGNINDSVSLVRAMVKQYEESSSYKAVFYTDSPVDTEDLNAEVVSLASELTNVSLDYISYSIDNEKLTALVRATNRSDEPFDREISFYGGDRILGIKDVRLPARETVTVYFKEMPADVPYIWAELTEKDDLEEDNQVYSVVKPAKLRKVLLMSEGNVFMEKALSNINGLELYKTNPGEDLDEGYDLYIFDSALPSILPKSGSILLLNPPEGNGIIEVGEEVEGGIADILMHSITKYMDNANFTVSKLKSMKAPFWSDVLIGVNGNSAVLSGEYNGRKTAVIGFDLHNSDFALTAEYPIFVYNLTAYLAGMDTGGRTSYICGDPIDLIPDPEVREALVTDPEGVVHKLKLTYPMQLFDKTAQYGVYRLTQSTEESERVSSFAVNFPVESESVNIREFTSEDQKTSEAGSVLGGIRLQEWLICFLLLFAAVEWVVYIRGY